MHRLIWAVVIVLLAGAERAAAYTCTLSPDKGTVIVKTSNPAREAMACTVKCRFVTPEEIVNITCKQDIPAGARDWYVCIRPTGGKPYVFDSGSEDCAKP